MSSYEQMTREELIEALQTRELEARLVSESRHLTQELEELLHDLERYEERLTVQNQELRRTQDNLEETVRRYEDLYHFSPVGNVSLDGDSRIHEINLTSALLLGTERSQLLGRSFLDFIPAEASEKFQAALNRCLATKEIVTSELPLCVGRKGTIVAEIILYPAWDSRLNELLCRCALTDVTARKRAEQALLQAHDELEKKVAERTAELVAANGKLVMMAAEPNLFEERARRHIAQQLHDQVVQTLALGKIKLDLALRKKELPDNPAVWEIMELIELSIGDLRSLSFDLSPPILYELGLHAALASLGDRLAREHGFRFTIGRESDELNLREDLKIALFQMTREMLINAVKHARAQSIRVDLQRHDDLIEVVVADDGEGFDPEDYREGFGLANIRQRATFMGGRLQVSSQPGRGTRVEVSVHGSCTQSAPLPINATASVR